MDVLAAASKSFTEAKKRPSTSSSRLYTVKVKEAVNGTVTVSQTILYEGSSLTVTATPNENYVIDTVRINGKSYGNAAVITIPEVQGNMYVEVTFKLAWKNPFVDVNENDWFYSYVAWAHFNGIANGTSENTFSPDTALTRSMLVTFLWRAEGCPDAALTAGFSDVADGMFYTEAVAWAAENGIVMGYSDGRFGPDDVITREQIAVIMYRVAEYRGYDVTAAKTTDLSAFTDTASVSDYALDGMRWAVGYGLMVGRDGSRLEPKGKASRAESVTILARFYADVK